MAKKTVFEGVINGVKFDNVQAYNDMLTRLLASGEEITASTSTRSEGIGCNCCENACCQCECNELETVMMLPGFDNGDNKEYVDGFISDNADEDVASLAVLKEKLANNLEGIIHRVHSMDEAALENYEADVEKVQDIITQDTQATEDVISKKEVELQKLKRCLAVLNVWKDSYASIKGCIEDAQTKYQSGSCEPTSTKDNIDEQVAKELENRLTGALTKLSKVLNRFGVDLKDLTNVKIGY